MNLEHIGWNAFFENHFSSFDRSQFTVGRIALEHKDGYELYAECGLVWGEITGKLRFKAENRSDLPAVGDWVVIELRPEQQEATIHAVLPRQTAFSRKAAGTETEEQIVASNVDFVFLVTAADADFNLRRMERYVTLARESGAQPIIILNKSDVCDDLTEKVHALENAAPQVPVIFLSAAYDKDLSALTRHLKPHCTYAFLGSSGVGKSTIINRLTGTDAQKTEELRKNQSGKHTTTHRELILLDSGALVMDTPGMRELQLWGGESGLGQTFEDIESLAGQCRFNDCSHESEPDCAVKDALEKGELDAARFKNYIKMKKELRFLELKQDDNALRLEKLRWKKIHRAQKRHYKGREKP